MGSNEWLYGLVNSGETIYDKVQRLKETKEANIERSYNPND